MTSEVIENGRIPLQLKLKVNISNMQFLYFLCVSGAKNLNFIPSITQAVQERICNARVCSQRKYSLLNEFNKYCLVIP